MTKIIVLNGPPRCGKDTAADAIAAYFADFDCRHIKLSEPLKDIVSRVVGHSKPALEANKSTVIPGWASSYRDFQIYTFESLARVFGSNWLGRTAVHTITQAGSELIVMSDCGRAEELDPLIRHYGGSNIMVIQVLRDGCTFDYDIRNYVSDSRCVTKVVANKDLASYIATVIDIAGEFYA